jgi:hypothetical protein
VPKNETLQGLVRRLRTNETIHLEIQVPKRSSYTL